MTTNTPVSDPGGQPPAASTGTSTTLRTVLLVVGSIILVVVLVGAVLRITFSLNQEDTSGDFRVTQQFDAIDLRASAADVRIDYQDVSQPELRFDQGDANLRFEHSVSGGELLIEVRTPGWGWWGWDFGEWGWWGDRPATLLVVLPESQESEGIALTLDSTAGNMDVFGEFGDIQLESTAGDVQLRGGAESVEIRTTAGDVRLTDFSLTGPFRSESTAGDVRFEFLTLPARMDVQSTAGDVEVELPKGSYRIDTDTTAGEILQNVSSDANSDRVYRFETTAGDIAISER